MSRRDRLLLIHPSDALSFGEHLSRFWIENEIWWWPPEPQTEPGLTAEQRQCVEHFADRG
jgi:hypothetical protein